MGSAGFDEGLHSVMTQDFVGYIEGLMGSGC
jgi:hypothetical protein